MNPNSSDSSSELVLDNRRLIIIFFLLIATCGAFFLIGFMEGKRQGQRARADQSLAAQPDMAAKGGAKPEARGTPPQVGAKPVDNAAINSQLDWYGTVNQPSAPRGRPEKDRAAEDKGTAAKAATEKTASRSLSPPAPRTEEKAPPSQAGALKYSVQVGAFRQAEQAEARASALKAKGYPCSVLPPAGTNELYLVRVGEFDSRADAVAMQLRLKKDGLSSFIKTSR
jgi:cell division protein FtsN